MNRRIIMKWIVRGIGLTSAGLVGAPSIISALSPALKKYPKQLWHSIGSLNLFPIDSVKPASVGLISDGHVSSLNKKGVYVWRKSNEGIVVFSRSCTDLGCPVKWDGGSECYFCPCHGGIFSKEGNRMAGPPKRPLYRYQARIKNGEVQIDLRSVPPMV